LATVFSNYHPRTSIEQFLELRPNGLSFHFDWTEYTGLGRGSDHFAEQSKLVFVRSSSPLGDYVRLAGRANRDEARNVIRAGGAVISGSSTVLFWVGERGIDSSIIKMFLNEPRSRVGGRVTNLEEQT
jgi:hypothetical protein